MELDRVRETRKPAIYLSAFKKSKNSLTFLQPMSAGVLKMFRRASCLTDVIELTISEHETDEKELNGNVIHEIVDCENCERLGNRLFY